MFACKIAFYICKLKYQVLFMIEMFVVTVCHPLAYFHVVTIHLGVPNLKTHSHEVI